MTPLLHVRPDTLAIVHHNTEGSPSRVEDIKSHRELCLSETRLQGSFVADSLHLVGDNMFKRNRHPSYTHSPQVANGAGGGVAVYVKNIQVCEKQYVRNVRDLECVALKVRAPVSALTAAVYRPPGYRWDPSSRTWAAFWTPWRPWIVTPSWSVAISMRTSYPMQVSQFSRCFSPGDMHGSTSSSSLDHGAVSTRA
ncbi:hypothetical protein KUCAC02_035757 [Chaenocephalus aceratus]|nr:hypothetical protein KUCAC02_035757 [Chaenocephalus aceratus]